MGKKYFTLSYDDGLEQDKRLIQLMKQYGLKGTFNLNAGLFNRKGTVRRIGSLAFQDCGPDMISGRVIKYTKQYRLPVDEIAQVYEGMEIASHSYTHDWLGRLPEEEMKRSIDLDLEGLEKIVGRPILGHAYAKGSTSKAVQAYLRQKGIIYARGIMPGRGFAFPKNPLNMSPTCSHIDSFASIERKFQKFIALDTQEDALFLMWGHAYELDFGLKEASWDKLERIFQLVSGRQDVVYCTNAQAFQAHMVKEDV